MENVINMAIEAGDGTLQTPEMCMQDCINNYIGKKGAYQEGKKLFIVCLDDEDDGYQISWNQSGMNIPEIIALLDFTKGLLKKEMGF